jgi:hypothetical protein
MDVMDVMDDGCDGCGVYCVLILYYTTVHVKNEDMHVQIGPSSGGRMGSLPLYIFCGGKKIQFSNLFISFSRAERMCDFQIRLTLNSTTVREGPFLPPYDPIQYKYCSGSKVQSFLDPRSHW